MDSARPIRLAALPNLQSIWFSSSDVRRRGRSAGIDGIRPERFALRLDDNLRHVRKRMLSPNFKYYDLRPTFIPRESKPDRVICVPVVEDRLIQRVALAYLTEGDKLSVKNSVSYGFHRGSDTGVREAVLKARNLRIQHRWVLKSDIQSFFDQIDRTSLKTDLRRTLRQRSVLPFLLSAIDTEIRPFDNADRTRLSRTGITEGRGLRQGMPLSPILSNFVLRDFDRAIIKANLRMVRYADDFVIICDSEDECHHALALVTKLLERRGHTVPPLESGSKTQIFGPADSVDFLGFNISPWKRKYRILAPSVAWARIHEIALPFRAYLSCRAEYPTLPRALQALDMKLSSFGASYRIAKNHDDLLDHIAQCRTSTIQKLLSDVFGINVLAQVNVEKLAFLGLSPSASLSISQRE